MILQAIQSYFQLVHQNLACPIRVNRPPSRGEDVGTRQKFADDKDVYRQDVPVAPETAEGLRLLVGNLDFEARVPVPFSIFPSSYKDDKTAEVQTTTQTHEEVEIKLPEKKAGREGQYSSSQASVHLPPRHEQHRYSEEEVRITREEERYRRPGVHHEHYVENRRPASAFSETYVEVDRQHRPSYSAIDQIEREYRSRYQPTYQEEVRVSGTTIDPPASSHARPSYDEHVRVETTVDASKPAPSYHKETKVTEETVEYPRSYHSGAQKSRMGYYDESGHYHSFRHGLHKMADKVFHHDHVEVSQVRERAPRHSEPSAIPNTVTIPCHHVRMGDILMLQGRPCQVIRISTSAATGQHRYLGVDLFTKQLHEESSFVSNPAPSVVVQTMLGPVFKQYRVLDIQDGSVVAMTETGDVKTGIPVTDQSGLWTRLSKAFESGRGSVRVLVLNDGGRELVVDVKTIHASSL
ncbi:putative Translation elongation factor IF5A C-terminal domain-containing protein [Seiridium cardinale]|uniref:Translation elongation factor IF5A C-terminal domain-containing protein n=1 Tax=Seiridium cardinale TaxID=138064 RepID=A0ABR2XRA7_9PEZI